MCQITHAENQQVPQENQLGWLKASQKANMVFLNAEAVVDLGLCHGSCVECETEEDHDKES